MEIEKHLVGSPIQLKLNDIFFLYLYLIIILLLDDKYIYMHAKKLMFVGSGF